MYVSTCKLGITLLGIIIGYVLFCDPIRNLACCWSRFWQNTFVGWRLVRGHSCPA